jgi:hypothetical protein
MWDPSPTAGVNAYRVFVGTVSGQYTETFDVPSTQRSFVYNPTVVGQRYYFAVASRAATTWGAPSPEVSEVNGASAGAAPAPQPSPVAPDRPRFAVPRALDGSSAVAAVEVFRAGLGPVTSLAVSGAGTGLFVEDGRTVRVFDSAGIRPEAALRLDEDVEIEDLALDPMFDRNGHVVLATSRTQRGGDREVSIERYRLLGGGLGEAATLVVGLDDQRDTRTLLTQTGDGRMLVVESNAVSAFSAGGARQPLSSGLAADRSHPSSVAWDEQGQTVWLTGRTAGGAGVIERLGAAGQRARVVVPAGFEDGPLSTHVNGSAVVVAGASTGGVLAFDPATGAAVTRPVDLGAFGDPVLVARVPAADAWFVVVREARSDGSSSDTLVRVVAPPAVELPIR